MSDKKLFKGVRYEIACSSGVGDTVTFQAVEDGRGVVQLVITVSADDYDGTSVYVAPENLTEAFTAIVAAFGTTATEGARRAEAELSPLARLLNTWGKAADAAEEGS